MHSLESNLGKTIQLRDENALILHINCQYDWSLRMESITVGSIHKVVKNETRIQKGAEILV